MAWSIGGAANASVLSAVMPTGVARRFLAASVRPTSAPMDLRDGLGLWGTAAVSDRFESVASASSLRRGMDRLQDSDFAVIDLETTGFAADGADRVVEIAVLRCRPNEGVIGRFVTLVDPQRSMRASHVHGVLAGHVRGAPRFRDVAPRVLGLLDGAVVVAHNSRFDLAFLSAELRRSNRSLPAGPTLCTMALCARLDVPVGGRSLDACCEHFAIPRRRVHGAEHDAQATAALLLCLLREAQRRGWSRLSELGCDYRPSERPSRTPTASVPTLPERAAAGHVHRAAQRLGETWPIDDIDGAQYLDLLDRVLLDRVLTASEVDALEAMARRCRLDDRAVANLHAEYLKRLGQAAWSDGELTADEQEDLLHVRRLLQVRPAAEQAVREGAWA